MGSHLPAGKRVSTRTTLQTSQSSGLREINVCDLSHPLCGILHYQSELMKKRPKYHAQGEHEEKEGFNQSRRQREKTAEEAFRNPPFFPLLTDMETEARRGNEAQLGSRKPEGWSSPLRESGRWPPSESLHWLGGREHENPLATLTRHLSAFPKLGSFGVSGSSHSPGWKMGIQLHAPLWRGFVPSDEALNFFLSVNEGPVGLAGFSP